MDSIAFPGQAADAGPLRGLPDELINALDGFPVCSLMQSLAPAAADAPGAPVDPHGEALVDFVLARWIGALEKDIARLSAPPLPPHLGPMRQRLTLARDALASVRAGCAHPA